MRDAAENIEGGIHIHTTLGGDAKLQCSDEVWRKVFTELISGGSSRSAIRLNSQNYDNFKDEEGRSTVPYLLVFGTKN